MTGTFLMNQFFHPLLQKRDESLAIYPTILLLDLPSEILNDRFHLFFADSKLSPLYFGIKN
jgi:hypothetical protein